MKTYYSGMTLAEMLMLISAVKASADDLVKYETWINDRPALPARELAINMVRAETKKYRELQLKLMEILDKEETKMMEIKR